MIKSETAGPFPADGSNRHNVLTDSAVFRRDIRSNLDGNNIQDGAEFTLNIYVVNASNNSEPLAGAAVYLWHCNAAGEYSAYAAMGQSHQNNKDFLRGVQITDLNGQVTFVTIYRWRYRGRATHFHVAIYKDDSLATELNTTQFAFDESITNTVYASGSAYDKSDKTREIANSEDYIFRDGYDGQLLKISGDPGSGYVVTIVVGI